MQPSPGNTPPGAFGPPPPSSGGPNTYRRVRPHKHGTSAPATAPPSQPMTNPFAFAGQGFPSHNLGSQVPPLNASPVPMQVPPPAVFNAPAPVQATSPGPPGSFPPAPPPHHFHPPSEPGYFNSQEAMPYISQLPNSNPTFSTPPLQSDPASRPMPPAHSHPGPDHASRPPSVQNYFQPTTDPPQSYFAPPQTQALNLNPSPHSQNHSPSAWPPNSQQQSQNYLSQTGRGPEAWLNQVPQDLPHNISSLPYTIPSSSDPGTLSMFLKGNEVENEETLSSDGRINGLAHPPNETPNAPEKIAESVENLECAPNQEVLPNVETPEGAPRPARSASVSSGYSNVSHGSGHAPHRRHQGVVGTFIQRESPRPPDRPASHASGGGGGGGYFEQVDSASASSPTFPTPSPPKPVGVFQSSANSSFEPVRSHSVGVVRPLEVDRARTVMEKRGVDVLPGNLEQPPDNMETIFIGQDHKSRTQGPRRACDSPATTLWAQSDANLGANILLAPAAPLLVNALVPMRQPSAEVIQPPEDGPPDLQNLENPPDSAARAAQGYASLLVSAPPTEVFNQSVMIAPPSTSYSSVSSQIPKNISPKSATSPVYTSPQALMENQVPQGLPSTNQTPSSQSQDENTVQSARSPVRSQSITTEHQAVPPLNPQIQSSAPTNHNPLSNFQLLDFSMHQSQSTNPPPSHITSSQTPVNNAPGFYLQVTKDAQQGARSDNEPPLQMPAPNNSYPAQAVSSQHQLPRPVAPVSQAAPQPGVDAASNEPQRPPSAPRAQQGYGGPAPVPPPGPGYANYYPAYQDGKPVYPPPFPVDPRAQNYYQVFLVCRSSLLGR